MDEDEGYATIHQAENAHPTILQIRSRTPNNGDLRVEQSANQNDAHVQYTQADRPKCCGIYA